MDTWMVPGDTTGSYHWAVQYHIFIEYIILYGPVVRQRPSHGTHHSGREVFTRLSILLPQDPIITHSHPSITLCYHITIISLYTNNYNTMISIEYYLFYYTLLVLYCNDYDLDSYTS